MFARSHVPRSTFHVPRSHVPRSTFARSHVPTFHVRTFPRSHVPRSHVPRSTFPRSHVPTFPHSAVAIVVHLLYNEEAQSQSEDSSFNLRPITRTPRRIVVMHRGVHQSFVRSATCRFRSTSPMMQSPPSAGAGESKNGRSLARRCATTSAPTAMRRCMQPSDPVASAWRR